MDTDILVVFTACLSPARLPADFSSVNIRVNPWLNKLFGVIAGQGKFTVAAVPARSTVFGWNTMSAW